MLKDIFKVSIYNKLLNEDCETIAKYCKEYQSQNNGRIISNVGGYQSPDLQGEHFPLNNLFKEILLASEDYAQQLQMTQKLTIDNIWINVNGYKDSNNSHIHPHSLFSGVFYVQCTPESGNIQFTRDDIMTYDWNDETIEQQNESNAWSYYQVPENNRLLIFPSWLNHSVKSNMSDKERISISFNVC